MTGLLDLAGTSPSPKSDLPDDPERVAPELEKRVRLISTGRSRELGNQNQKMLILKIIVNEAKLPLEVCATSEPS